MDSPSRSPANKSALGSGKTRRWTTLHSEAKGGNLQQLKILLGEDNKDVNVKDNVGKAPIHYAVVANYHDCVMALIETGADVNALDDEGKSPLYLALVQNSEANNRAVIKLLLTNGGDPYAGKTPISYATSEGKVDLVELLGGDATMVHYASIAIKTSPLHNACSRGDAIELARLIQDSDVTFNAQNYMGRLPIHYAAERGHLACIQVLTGAVGNRGDYQTAQDKKGKTPVQLAVSGGHVLCVLALGEKDPVVISHARENCTVTQACEASDKETLDFLLSIGRLADESDITDGRTALHVTAERSDMDWATLLLDKGASLTAADNEGRTALVIALQKLEASSEESHRSYLGLILDREVAAGQIPLYAPISADRPAWIALLLAAGQSVNAQVTGTTGHEGKTACHLAAQSGRTRCLQALLARPDINLSLVDVDGRSPCHLAARNNHVDCLNLLIEAGLDVSVADRKNKTPLLLALEQSSLQCIAPLVTAGADICKDDLSAHGYTPLHRAVLKEDKEGWLKLLLETNAVPAQIDQPDAKNNVPLHLACKDGNLECVRLLIDAGCDISKLNNEKQTALHVAAKAGAAECVIALCDSRADIDINTEDKSRYTPLRCALESETPDVECVKALAVERPGEIVRRDNSKSWSPLHTAVDRNKGAWLSLLMKAGADCNVRDENGMTPLHLASKLEKRGGSIRKLLVGAVGQKADLNQVDNEGQTALHHAAANGHLDNLRELLSKCAPESSRQSKSKDKQSRDKLALPIVLSSHFHASVVIFKDVNGHTASSLASAKGHDDCANELASKELLRAVFERKIGVIKDFSKGRIKDMNGKGVVEDTEGRSVCHLAVLPTNPETSSPSQSCSSDRLACIVYLLKEVGADVYKPDKRGKSAFYYALQNDDVEVVQAIVNAGIDLNAGDDEGKTPAYIATEVKAEKCLKILIEDGHAVFLSKRAALLNKDEKLWRLREFVCAGILFAASVCAFLLSGDRLTKTCDTYYGGLLLQPYLYIFVTVFLFKLLQFVFEELLVPGFQLIREVTEIGKPETYIKFAERIQQFVCCRQGTSEDAGAEQATTDTEGADEIPSHKHKLPVDKSTFQISFESSNPMFETALRKSQVDDPTHRNLLTENPMRLRPSIESNEFLRDSIPERADGLSDQHHHHHHNPLIAEGSVHRGILSHRPSHVQHHHDQQYARPSILHQVRSPLAPSPPSAKVDEVMASTADVEQVMARFRKATLAPSAQVPPRLAKHEMGDIETGDSATKHSNQDAANSSSSSSSSSSTASRFSIFLYDLFGEDGVKKWRTHKYTKASQSDPTNAFDDFWYQTPYLFLYLQVLSSFVAFVVSAVQVNHSRPVWQQYTNFYATIVNSSIPISVFSLWKMMFLDKRAEQMLGRKFLKERFPEAWLEYFTNETGDDEVEKKGRKQKPYPGLNSFLWFCLLFPVFILMPPVITHLLPAAIMYCWLILPAVCIYLAVFNILSSLEEEKDEGKKDDVTTEKPSESGLRSSQQMSETGARKNQVELFCPALTWRLLQNFQAEITKACTYILLWLEGKGFRRSFIIYHIDLFLEVTSRFLFVFLFQTLYNYASLYYADSASASASAAATATHGQQYMNVFKQDLHLRSQTACFLLHAYETDRGLVTVFSWF